MVHSMVESIWLSRCGNAMSPSFDKTLNAKKLLQIVPKGFYGAVAKFISISFVHGIVEFDGKRLLYNCMFAGSVEEEILLFLTFMKIFWHILFYWIHFYWKSHPTLSK